MAKDPGSDRLWRKRLAIEARWRRPILVRSNGSPLRMTRVSVRATLGVLLRLTGLLNRGKQNALSPILGTVDFTSEDLPERFDGFRLIHLSDFHFTGGPALAQAIGEVVQNAEADLCVMTGDYTFDEWGSQDHVYDAMASVLENVRARHGVVGVLGNNDRSDFVEVFQKMGVRMLVNENVEVSVDKQSIWIVGVDDPHYFRCANLSQAMQGVPAHAFTILLAHTPELRRKAAAYGIDLYLCGHTHGGQICLPMVGPVFFNTRCRRRYCRGRWRTDGLQGYTTAGLGTTAVNVRFNCPPEAVLITLHKKGKT